MEQRKEKVLFLEKQKTPNNSLKMVYLLHLLEIVVEMHCEFVVAFCSEILILG